MVYSSYALLFYTITNPASPQFPFIDSSSLQLPNGKLLYIQGKSATTNNFYIYQIGPSGTLYASQISTIGNTGKYALGIYLKDATKVIIYGTTMKTNQIYHFCALYDFVANSLSVTYTSRDTGYSTAVTYVSQAFVYSGKLCYVATHTVDYYATKTDIVKIDLTTYEVTTTSLDAFYFASNQWGIADSIDSKYAYIMGCKDGDSTRPIFYKVDWSANTITYLAECPQNTVIRYTSVGLRVETSEIERDESNNYILYWTWVSGDTYAGFDICQNRLVFNSSGIFPANLIYNNFRHGYLTTSWGTGVECPVLNVYLEDKDTFYMWYVNRHGYPDYIPYWQKAHFEVADWYNYVDTEIVYTDLGEQTDIPTREDMFDTNRIYKDNMATFMVWEDYSNVNTYIYCGLLPSRKDWDISITYSPSGDYYTATQYLMVCTLTLNTYAYANASVTVKVDNATLTTKKTDELGKFTFTMLINVAGYHELKFDVIIGTSYQDTVLKPITVLTNPSEDEGQQISTTLLYMFITILPILFVVLLPCILLGALIGPMGYVIGLGLGSTLAFMVNLMPLSGFALIILLIAVFVVIVIKSGR